MKKPYNPPAISAEDEMEQTALQTCWVTEPNENQNFVNEDCANRVEKNENAFFDEGEGCTVIYTGDKFDVQVAS